MGAAKRSLSVCDSTDAGEDMGERVEVEDGVYISRMTSSPCAFFSDSASPLTWFFFRRASRWPITRFTWANLRVRFATPIVAGC